MESMYVNLYPPKQLKQTKQFILLIGVLLVIGGAYALVRELFFQDLFRFTWAITSIIVLLIGLLWSFVGKNTTLFKESYFSLDQEQIAFRLSVMGKNTVIPWQTIQALQIQEHVITFQLKSGETIHMRLGNIQQPEVAMHVSRSILLAALEKHIIVNGVKSDHSSSPSKD